MALIRPQIDAKKRVSETLGSCIEAHHSVRDLNFFVVSEEELQAKSFHDQLSSGAFAIASSLISFGIGLYVQATFSDRLSLKAQLLCDFGAPVSCVFGSIALVVGVWSHLQRSSQLARIRLSSRPRE